MFPDDAFRAVAAECDTNKDGMLDKEEISAVTELSCRGKGVKSVQGVEVFTALESFDCSRNSITVLDVSNNPELRVLNCYDNYIGFLELKWNKKLKELKCSSNEIKELNLSRNRKLELLWCNDNDLSSIDISENTRLISFECAGNKRILELNLSNNPDLERICCEGTQIRELDIRNCGNLVRARTDGTEEKRENGVLWLYKVPGRKETQTSNGTNRDSNTYGLMVNEGTVIIWKHE